jgi:sulfide:quinone oxidoreductase
MTRIAVLGSGFAALTTIRELRRHHVDAEIVVVSPPSLIWVPSGLRTAADRHVPLDGFFARHRVT